MSVKVSIDSERLYMKPIDKSYCNQTYLSWLNDKKITAYLEIFDPYSESQLMDYLAKAESDNNLHFWAIHLKSNDKHIGNIKIDPINRYHGYGEYGIMMGDSSEWGKGYAEEASRMIINYCFEVEKLRKINLGVVEENFSAVKLYKKLGFEVEGTFKKHGLYEGRYCNLLRMAIFNPHF